MRAGVIGISRCLMPNTDSASITASATAGSPPEQAGSNYGNSAFNFIASVMDN
jgi:hypothetical protein